jgi:hypothetical protein
MVMGCFILPCLLPLDMQSILTLIEVIVERETVTQLHLLQGYQGVNLIPEDERDDAF